MNLKKVIRSKVGRLYRHLSKRVKLIADLYKGSDHGSWVAYCFTLPGASHPLCLLFLPGA